MPMALTGLRILFAALECHDVVHARRCGSPVVERFQAQRTRLVEVLVGVAHATHVEVVEHLGIEPIHEFHAFILEAICSSPLIVRRGDSPLVRPHFDSGIAAQQSSIWRWIRWATLSVYRIGRNHRRWTDCRVSARARENRRQSGRAGRSRPEPVSNQSVALRHDAECPFAKVINRMHARSPCIDCLEFYAAVNCDATRRRSGAERRSHQRGPVRSRLATGLRFLASTQPRAFSVLTSHQPSCWSPSAVTTMACESWPMIEPEVAGAARRFTVVVGTYFAPLVASFVAA